MKTTGASTDSPQEYPFTHMAVHNGRYYEDACSLNQPPDRLSTIMSKRIDCPDCKRIYKAAHSIVFNYPQWEEDDEKN